MSSSGFELTLVRMKRFIRSSSNAVECCSSNFQILQKWSPYMTFSKQVLVDGAMRWLAMTLMSQRAGLPMRSGWGRHARFCETSTSRAWVKASSEAPFKGGMQTKS
eukprot:6480485-Amphidinium_carterae.3